MVRPAIWPRPNLTVEPLPTDGKKPIPLPTGVDGHEYEEGDEHEGLVRRWLGPGQVSKVSDVFDVICIGHVLSTSKVIYDVGMGHNYRVGPTRVRDGLCNRRGSPCKRASQAPTMGHVIPDTRLHRFPHIVTKRVWHPHTPLRYV